MHKNIKNRRIRLFAAGGAVSFTVHRELDEMTLGVVPATPAEVGSVVDL